MNTIIIYRLKALVLVRLLSEVTLLVILLGIPVVLLINGKFWTLPMPARIVFCTMSLISLLILPIYGFITFLVETDDKGIKARSTFQNEFCPWTSIRRMSRRSSWNWIRYVVESDEGELTFPIELKNCDQLVDQIRVHLPIGVGQDAQEAQVLFRNDTISMLWQAGQAAYGLIFLGVTWYFFYIFSTGTEHVLIDRLILLAFALALTGILGWRTVTIAMMPKWLELTESGIRIRTYFFEKLYAYSELVKVEKPSPFLPEGFVLKLRKISYLVGSNTSASDELEEALKNKIDRNRQL